MRYLLVNPTRNITHQKTVKNITITTALVFIICIISTDIYAEEKYVYAQIEGTPDQRIGVEVLKIAYQRLDLGVEFIFFPAKRALNRSSSGLVDGEVHRIWKIGEDYPTLLRVPTPINVLETTAFTHVDNHFLTRSCDDLKAYSIVRVRGVRHSELCSAGFKDVTELFDSSKLIRFLALKRTDIGIDARINGLIYAKRLKLSHLVKAIPTPLKTLLLYHYVHEKNKHLIPLLDTEFKKMVKSGEMKLIRENKIAQILSEIE